MLTTSNDYSNVFLDKKRILLDSCILNDWATCERTKSILESAEKQYQFVFCNISMLEVGFGPTDKADKDQIAIARSIYSSDNLVTVDSESLAMREFRKQETPENCRISYNPSHHEYLAARTYLIQLMEVKGFGGKRARELNNDALIFFCAWNSRSAVITNNVKDFQLFNEAMMQSREQHMLPIYTISDLENSLEAEISFPENLESI